MQKNEQLQQVLKQREVYRHRAFVMMLEIAAIIALPAAAAAIVGTKLDQTTGAVGRRYTFLLLAAAFIVSWAAIIIKYKKFNKKMKKIDKEIIELRDKLKNND